MFLDILEFKIENNKKIKENCLENVVFNLWEKSLCVRKSALRKKFKK